MTECADCSTPVLNRPLCAYCTHLRKQDMIACEYCERQATVEVYQETTTYIREIDADGVALDPLDEGENQDDYEKVGDSLYRCDEHRHI